MHASCTSTHGPEEGIQQEWYRRHVSICGKRGEGNAREYAVALTYCGYMPNIRAVDRRDMTPKKNVIFSRVRTIFADCQDAVSDVMR